MEEVVEVEEGVVEVVKEVVVEEEEDNTQQ